VHEIVLKAKLLICLFLVVSCIWFILFLRDGILNIGMVL